MKILALDLASQTGIAFGRSLAPPRCWSVDLGKGDDRKFANALRMTRTLIQKFEPDLIAIEAPIQGRVKSSFLIGLAACVRGAATDLGVPYEMHEISAIRRHFLGYAPAKRDFIGSEAQKTKQIKALVMNRCRALGWTVPDSDASDAAAVWDYAMSMRRADHARRTVGGLFGG